MKLRKAAPMQIEKHPIRFVQARGPNPHMLWHSDDDLAIPLNAFNIANDDPSMGSIGKYVSEQPDGLIMVSVPTHSRWWGHARGIYIVRKDQVINISAWDRHDKEQ